ncbi:NAD(P)-binding domain-containing protein [Mesorhizobium sp. M0761]|uniref:NAD(P)-binding domain-containing protein n=1 Tax=unclassified Mesorhizobium TaxID=325217 RepID=UPI0003CF5E31|nr:MULTISPECIES: NAD(P)-binding domain-containing protein [unclassified Mesorhizobium]ESX51800.1 FAD-dependent pyridine nucleotide-disulfide oxidoreductase [Mesorhizobium sp. LSHC422A00]ESY07307.1 FAD-dependent pyridine nucleotide-disulfide oxidoreductase [Mesorhizobium sp. LNJC399B00]WJI70600.1 NAD(P)-binding domain-containing protein [Mesorhizobium sp. C399B]
MSESASRGIAGAVDVVVIGAGHSGLAMSYLLGQHSLTHVVLERGEVANSWRTERWDSLRLFTPNWMARLPDYPYRGDDSDGYMSADQIADFISDYATYTSAPVLTHTTVNRVAQISHGFRVETQNGDWLCRAVVLATGAFNKPVIPRLADSMPATVEQISAHSYRNPGQLAPGGVLVVGASATGLQLAQEIQLSGRPVTLAVGEHVRLPRVYRGRDIQWWMLATGVLDQRIEDADDPDRARRVPSPQLVGTSDRATLDLNVLRGQGVKIVGRLMGIRDATAQFSGSLRNVCALADLKMNRLLASIDEWAEANAPSGVGPAERFVPTRVGETSQLELKLGEDIRTVLWATGFRPDFSWLDLPILDRKGDLKHSRGVADVPGVYVLGLPYLRRRKSSFIHGAEDDVRELSTHIADYLDRPTSQIKSRLRSVAI